MNDIMTNHSYYIKKTVFEGDNDNLVELISVTEEICEKSTGKTVYTPVIVASHIREISLKDAKKHGLSIHDEDLKLFISDEQAEQLVNMKDESLFLSTIYNIIS
ncbi:hypothetical protein AWM68_17240 [Fictibacillus phosphorivorans]|uniref:Uncharacterized protein n=1 Tax=Fictibacillus phosphorivorans TaxID=1221500 RepID=A0A163S0T4_9BACL|nr:hypothetical protein [Fictibacillus phosphorivorans]KZE67919.1 hypothetical protein AWM68_17240 [Fictibacillus phosphorivorans]